MQTDGFGEPTKQMLGGSTWGDFAWGDQTDQTLDGTLLGILRCKRNVGWQTLNLKHNLKGEVIGRPR